MDIFKKFHNIFSLTLNIKINTGSLSPLDFKMQISPTGKIYTSFIEKPPLKNLFVHFKSALQLSAETNYIRNEIKQIHNRCSEEKDTITCTAHNL